jgi:TorA maturation chaperone TorD
MEICDTAVETDGMPLETGRPAEWLLRQETVRSRVYRRLADAYRPPRQRLRAAIAELPDMLALLGSPAATAARDMRNAFSTDDAMTDMHIEFARIFVGPFFVPAPPYGSVYLEGARRVMGNSTVDARDHYRNAGFDLSEDYHEAPDHMAVELEFMHLLICQAAEAILGRDREGLLTALDRQRRFLTRHLGAWVEAFTDRVTEHAAIPFYRLLAQVTRSFVLEERQAMVERASAPILC